MMRFVLQSLLVTVCTGFFAPAWPQTLSPAAANVIRQQPQVLNMAGYILNQAIREQTYGRLYRPIPPNNTIIDDEPIIRYENMTIPPGPLPALPTLKY